MAEREVCSYEDLDGAKGGNMQGSLTEQDATIFIPRTQRTEPEIQFSVAIFYKLENQIIFQFILIYLIT